MSLALSTGPLAQAIGWALVHLLWQGTLVALVLAAALALSARKSANLRYALSCAALALVVALGVGTAVVSYRTPTPEATGRNVALGMSDPTPSTHQPLASPAPTTADRLAPLARTAADALPLLVTLWLAGVALFSVRLLVEWIRVRRLVARSANPAAEPLAATARRLATALGVRRIVRVVESTAVVVPSVVGFARPVILVPASALTGLSPAQLEMILAHELAHVRRHDFLVNLLQSVVETLVFYHPAVWWISARVRDERENCCDDLAVAVCGDPLLYARTLTRLEELRGPAPVLAASANGGSLLERVRRLVAAPTRGETPVARGAVALSALSVVLVALAAFALPAVGAKKPAPVAVHALHPAPAAEPAPEPAPEKVVLAAPAPLAAPLRAPAPLSAPLTALAPLVTTGADADAEAEAETEAEAPVADGKPTLDELIALKVHGVTGKRIKEVRALFPRATLEEIAGMSAVGATPEYVREMRNEGLEVADPDQASGLAALNVTPKYVRGLRLAGIRIETSDDASGLAAVGVTPDYVRRMRRAGVDLQDADDAQGLAAQNVTVEFVERLRNAGFRRLTAEQLSRLAAAGLTGDFVEEMSRYRSR